jgi:hypothetical protein
MTNNDRVHVRLGDDDGLRFRFVPDVEATHDVPPELQDRVSIEDDDDDPPETPTWRSYDG